MVMLTGKWKSEMKQVPEDTAPPETAGWRFRLYDAAGVELHVEEEPSEGVETGKLIEVGPGTYTLKSLRMDVDGNEFGDEVVSNALEIKPGMVGRLVMTSLELLISPPTGE